MQVSRQLLHLEPSSLFYQYFYYCTLYTAATQCQPTALTRAQIVQYGNSLLRLFRDSMNVLPCCPTHV